MKNRFSISLLVLAAAALLAPALQAQIDPAYNGLLKKYVTDSGVNYAAWKANAADMAAIERVVQSIAKAPASTATSKEQLAFHLHAYNAWILREKLREYPNNRKISLLAVLPYFNKKRITVAGKEMSLNNLESDLIRPRFKEARIHFALNCASVSCPPLLNEAFDAKKLDAQLDGLARKFVNKDLYGVKAPADGKSAEVSKIFDWYKDDFTPAGGVVAFINKFRTNKLAADAKISYQPYLWNLNEAK